MPAPSLTPTTWPANPAQPTAPAAADSQPMARLFLALWPDPAARRSIADWAAGWCWPGGASVVAPQKWHLTLHFIGPVPKRRLPELTSALALPCPRFAIEFGAAAIWPGGIAALVPLELPAALVALHESLAAVLRRLDLPVERRAFRPHVTLARRAVDAKPPAAATRFRWPVRQFALVQSDSGYRTLVRYPA